MSKIQLWDYCTVPSSPCCSPLFFFTIARYSDAVGTEAFFDTQFASRRCPLASESLMTGIIPSFVHNSNLYYFLTIR